MKKVILLLLMVLVFGFGAAISFALPSTVADLSPSHPAEGLIGEELTYDVSFLWFDRLATGSVRFSKGEKPGTYLAVLEARTRGFAAMVTKDRIERIQTLMEIDENGMLRPLVHGSHSFKGKGDKQRERVTSYTFDYQTRQVKFQKVVNNRIYDVEYLPLDTDQPVFDLLSAFYNMRIGSFGPIDGNQIVFSTFHRRGVEEIVVAPVDRDSLKNGDFFAPNAILRKVLVDPEIFKTSGRDLLISFDETGRPQKAVVKNVIGLGDVRGVLRQAQPPLQASN